MKRKPSWRFLGIMTLILLLIYIKTSDKEDCITPRSNSDEDQNEEKVRDVITAFQAGLLKVKTGNRLVEPEAEIANDLFRGYEKLTLKDLETNFIPNEVIYIWCYNRTIEFRQFLSIKAAWKILRPDTITLYTQYEISDKDKHYNVWLSELKNSIPGFKVQVLPSGGKSKGNECGIDIAFGILENEGGIYLSDNLFPLKTLRSFRKNKFNVAMDKSMNEISVMSSERKSERLKKFRKLYQEANISPSLVPGLHFCDTLENINRTFFESSICINVQSVLPWQIMQLNSTFGELARTVLYGSPKQITGEPLLPDKIPKIFHMVWYGRKQMDFMMYLCLRSILFIAKPDKVYIHGDGQLYGKYMDELKKDIRIVQIYREFPVHIYGHQLLYMQHRSDIIRADVLLKYGGIYSDWDVLWLKPVDDLIAKGYDTILNLDHMPRPGFPDSINLGVLMSKPGAHFIKYWQDSLVNYRSRDFYYNAIELPYKTFEKYPHTVHIEPHLQVMCYYLKCHPTFHPNFRNFNEAQPFNWTTEVYSIHFTYPDPPEYANATALKRGHGMFTDIANYILSKN